MVAVQQQPFPQPPRPVPGPPPAQQNPDAEADPRDGIERAMTGLDNLDQVPLSEHVERFDTVHGELTSALSAIDRS